MNYFPKSSKINHPLATEMWVGPKIDCFSVLNIFWSVIEVFKHRMVSYLVLTLFGLLSQTGGTFLKHFLKALFIKQVGLSHFDLVKTLEMLELN